MLGIGRTYLILRCTCWTGLSRRFSLAAREASYETCLGIGCGFVAVCRAGVGPVGVVSGAAHSCVLEYADGASCDDGSAGMERPTSVPADNDRYARLD